MALFEDADPGPYGALRWGFDYEDKVSEAPSEEDMPDVGTEYCRREQELCMGDQERLLLLTGVLLPTYTLPW